MAHRLGAPWTELDSRREPGDELADSWRTDAPTVCWSPASGLVAGDGVGAVKKTLERDNERRCQRTRARMEVGLDERRGS